MVNLRFGIPLFLLIVHQHASNSVFGINNSMVGLTLFFLFLSSMCFFLVTNNKLGYSKLIAVLLLVVFIGLWQANPAMFKDLSNLYINFFITYYIVSQGGFQVMKNQLAIVVVSSALVMIVQMWGISPLVHEWNSQFLDERSGQMIRNIEVHNIMNSDFRNADWYDSRQVRAPGIFHSSALVSGIFVMYIAFIFCGYYKSLKNYALIPFLCFFSGAKLVLLATLLFLIVALFFRRITLKVLGVLIFSSILAVLIHKWLFYSLLEFQFNTELFFYSFDTRIKQYAWQSINFAAYLPYLFLVLVLGVGIFLINRVFKIWSNTAKIFHFTILTIAVISSFFSTPQIGNFLFGWFYFPAFFCFKYVYENKSNENFDS